jgi:hypothetical protein
MLRWLRRILVTIVVLVVGLFLYYYLPSRDIVRISGTQVKYMDSSGWFDSEVSSSANAVESRDVRFVNAVMPDGSIRVYRNENTDWGFPWYFKFDSGEIDGKAAAMVSTPDRPVWVVVTHYGWRLPLLAQYPNVIHIRQATGPDELLIPWFNIAFLSVLGFILFWIGFRVWRFKQETVDPVLDRIDENLDSAADAIDRRTDRLTKAPGGIISWIRGRSGGPR